MSARFDRLKEHVARQYERLGHGRERADHIGAAVAAQVEAEPEVDTAAAAPAAEEPKDG